MPTLSVPRAVGFNVNKHARPVRCCFIMWERPVVEVIGHPGSARGRVDRREALRQRQIVRELYRPARTFLIAYCS